ncbi:major prion protein homolog [Hyperolius riggenbachi]|uniref:major prion protein homolog n=1 Tax=Hyperolius riggenbachi TaxID=752182 RepID=UPI0035A31C54
MSRTLWTCLALISLLLVLTEASKKGGKSKGGGWGSSGSNRNPSYPGNTGSNWNPGQRNPNYPGNTGSNWNPGQQNPHYPANPGGGWNQGGGSNWNQGGGWGNNYNPGGSNYNKQFKPPKNKPNMKMVAGAAVAGAVGGFVLGNAFSNMRYSFDNDRESQYYNNYRNQMPNQVYRPMYQENTHVTEDRFVTDCYNSTMIEYVGKPAEEKNGTDVNEVEFKVKSTIIRQMCVSEFRRGPEYMGYNASGLRLPFSLSAIFFISLFVHLLSQ